MNKFKVGDCVVLTGTILQVPEKEGYSYHVSIAGTNDVRRHWCFEEELAPQPQEEGAEMNKVKNDARVIWMGHCARVVRKGYVQIVTENPETPVVIVHKSELTPQPQEGLK